jgi:hypothetical protein
VFWAQLVTLVASDLLLSLAILLLSLRLKPVLSIGEITCSLFWSLLVEVQIAIGVAGACRGSSGCVRTLRYMLPASLLPAAALTMLDTWFMSERRTEAHSLLWVSFFSSCALINIGAYVFAATGASSSPAIVRRRLMLRFASYACNFFVEILPNLTLDLLIAFEYITLDRVTMPDAVADHEVHGWDLVENICQYLYCLNGAFNVGTYVYWMWTDDDTAAATGTGLSRINLLDLEKMLQLNGYFSLTDTASAEARSVADAIMEAQLARQAGRTPLTRPDGNSPSKSPH